MPPLRLLCLARYRALDSSNRSGGMNIWPPTSTDVILGIGHLKPVMNFGRHNAVSGTQAERASCHSKTLKPVLLPIQRLCCLCDETAY